LRKSVAKTDKAKYAKWGGKKKKGPTWVGSGKREKRRKRRKVSGEASELSFHRGAIKG